MLFTTKLSQFVPSGYKKALLIQKAYLYAKQAYMSQNEANMDAYLRANYNISLKKAVLEIAANIIVVNNGNNTATIVLKRRDLDKIARLITYGIEEVKGIDVLKEILT